MFTGRIVLCFTTAFALCSAMPSHAQVVVSQAYGGGGNAGSLYRNDFIELYNRGSSPVSLAGWTVQYASATGSSWSTTALAGTIPAKSYYLVQQAAGTGGTQNLPTPDATGTINMSGTAFKVALVNSTTALSGTNPVGGPTVVDFVGAGATANGFEGTGPAPAPSNTASVIRKNGGETDTNDNAADFQTSNPPNPRNTSVNNLNPAISTAGSPAALGSFVGSVSSPQTFQVNGINLTDVIVASVSAGLQISSDGVAFSGTATFPAASGSASGTLYVRIAADALQGEINGQIQLASAGATSVTVPVSGVVRPVSLALPYGPQDFSSTSFPWYALTLAGSQNWTRGSDTAGNFYMEFNGFGSTTASRAWLILGPFNVPSTAAEAVTTFTIQKAFTGPDDELELVVSTNYDGLSDPSAATWSVVPFTKPVAVVTTSTEMAPSGNVVLPSSVLGQSGVFVAYRIVSPGTGASQTSRWRIDDFTLTAQGDPTAPSIVVSPSSLTTLGAVFGQPGTAQSLEVSGANLTGNLTVTAPINFEVSTTSATAGFVSAVTIPASGTLAPTNVWVRIAATAPAGAVGPANVTVSGGGATTRNVAVSGTVTDPSVPSLSVNPASLTSFSTTVGTASSAQTFAINAANLGSDVVITPPGGFAVSTNATTFSTAPITIPFLQFVSPTTVSVRLTGAAQGIQSGSVSIVSGALSRSVSVSGTVSPASSTSLTLSGTLTNFTAAQFVASAPQSFVVQGSGLTTNVTVSAPANLEFSTNSAGAYSASLVLPNSGGALSNTVFARIPDNAAIGGPTTNVITASSGATNATLSAVTTVSSNSGPFIVANPTSLSGFSTTEGTPSTNLQTFTVGATNLAGNLNIAAPVGYQVSTNGIDFVSSLALLPVGGTPVVTNLAIDDGNNYGGGWTNGANGGTGFGSWTITTSNNPPNWFAGAFIGNPTFAGIATNATFGTNSFGMYANPGGTAASATADRTFAALQDGQTFSFQWGINWDSDVGNKGFSLYSGGPSGTEILNVNQAGFPGDIRFIGGGVTNSNISLAFGTNAMTWSFVMTSSNNLLVTSTPRTGGTNVVFSTNIAVAAGPDSFRWYVSAMGAGDQRQQYYNNLKIIGTTASGNVAPTLIYVRIAGTTAGSVSGNINLTSAGAPTKTVALSGTVLPRPVITPTATLTPFAADLGTNSAAQSFTFRGTNLVGGVTLTAPAGYEISKTTNGVYASTLTYAQAEAQPGPATNWVRLAATAPPGIVAGNIALASQGAVTTNVPVTGRVTGDPVISVLPSALTNFFAAAGAPSDAQSFIARGVDLDGDIVLTASNSTSWEIRDPADGVYKSAITLVASNAVPVTFARDSATNAAYSGGWTSGSDGGAGFGPWSIATTGSATAAIANPTNAGIGGMATNSFALQGTNGYVTVQRSFDAPLLPGDTFSLQWGNNWDTGGAGNKGVNIYAGGFAETNQLININMGGSATITINDQPMFTQYGTAAITLNFQYVAPGQLRVFGTGRNGTETFDQTFAVPASPDGFSLYAGDLAAGPERVLYANDFAITTGSVGPSVNPTEILVRIKGTAPVNNALTGSVTAVSANTAPAVVSLGGIVSDDPEITETSDLAPFLAVQGFPSDLQTFTVGGNNLEEEGVLVRPPPGYQVSTNGSTWTTNVIVPRTGLVTPQQPVSIRIAPTNAVGTLAGDILLTSLNAPDVEIPITGEVVANSGPQLTATPTALPAFSAEIGTNSAAQTFILTGRGLTNPVALAAPSGFQISTNGVTFFSSNTISPPASGLVSNNVSVRLTGAAVGVFGGDVTANSAPASAKVAVRGAVFEAGTNAQILIDPDLLTGFATIQGQPSAPQTFFMAGRNLGSSVTNMEVTTQRSQAQPPYELSLDGAQYYGTREVAVVNGSLPATAVYVRLSMSAGAGTQNWSADVFMESDYITSVDLEGTVTPRPGIVVNPQTLSKFKAPQGTASKAQSFTVQGTNLLQDSITVTPPAGYEISRDETSGYVAAPIVLNGAKGVVALTRVYVRLASNNPVGLRNGELLLSTLNRTEQMALTGEVYPNVVVNTFRPPAADAPVRALTSDPQGWLYVGGSFTNLGTNAARGLARVAMDSGAFDKALNTGGDVYALAYAPTNASNTNAWLYAGGRFTNTNGTVAGLLKRFRLPSGELDAGFLPNIAGTNSSSASRVNALTVQPDGKLLVAGSFNGGLKRLQANGQIETNFIASANGAVNALLMTTNGGFLAGGAFTTVASEPPVSRVGLARFASNGAVDVTFLSGFGAGSVVQSLASGPGGLIYVGGSFSSYGGNTAYRNALVLSNDGQRVPYYGLFGGTSASVSAVMARDNGDLLLGGSFTVASNAVTSSAEVVGGLAQTRADGSLDEAFNGGGTGATGAGGTVLTICALPGGRLVLGGSFTSFNGDASLQNLAMLQIQQAPAYAAWATTWFGDSADPKAAPSAVNNAAGLPNLLVFALSGGSPFDANNSILPQFGIEVIDGGSYLTMQANRNPEALGTVTYTVQFSSNLTQAWSAENPVPVTIIPTASNMLKARSSQTVANPQNQFLRLMISMPP